MLIVITRKCITMKDIIVVTKSLRDQHVEERRDIGTRMHQNVLCMFGTNDIQRLDFTSIVYMF